MTDAATGTIYGLVDPRTNEVIYVGQTTKPLAVRLAGHLAAPAPLVRAWIEELAVEGGLPQIIPLREGIPADLLDAVEREEIRSHAVRRDLLNVASNELGNTKRRKASREEEKRRRKEEEAMDRTWHQAAWRQVADQIREATGGPISPADIPVREIHASAWSAYQAYRDADRRLKENIDAGLQFRPGVGVVVEGDGLHAQEKREALQQLNSARSGLEHYVRAYCGAFSAVDDGDYRGAVGAFGRGDEAYRNDFRDRAHMARYLSLIPWAARALDPWVALAREAGIDKKGPEFTAWVSDDPVVREAVDLYRMDASGWLGMPRQAWDMDVAIQMLTLGAAHIPGFTVPHLLEGELRERLTALARDRQATREMCLLLTEINPKALDAVYGRDELAESDTALGLPPGASAKVIRQVYGVDPNDPNNRAAKLLQRHTGEFDVAAIPGYSDWKGSHIPAVRVAAATFYSAGLFPHAELPEGGELLDRVKSTWMPGRWGLESIEELDGRLSRTAA